MPLQHASRVGGETVYNEAPLRFRNLSVAEPDLPTFGDLPGSQEGFKIRVARQASRHKEAGRMVDQRYNGRGYKTPASSPSEADPNLSTFLAYDEGRMVGTVSVRLDSPNRLSADRLYPEELAGLRRAGHKLCEFTRLAVDAKSASKPVLAGLFHTAFLYASRLHGFTHAVIEVNPRHVAFYQRSLGFEVVGGERLNTRVNAPGRAAGGALLAHRRRPAPGRARPCDRPGEHAAAARLSAQRRVGRAAAVEGEGTRGLSVRPWVNSQCRGCWGLSPSWPSSRPLLLCPKPWR